MRVKTRTAPAMPAKAARHTAPLSNVEAKRVADRLLAQSLGVPVYKPDFGSISRAEMRRIVIEMIG